MGFLKDGNKIFDNLTVFVNKSILFADTCLVLHGKVNKCPIRSAGFARYKTLIRMIQHNNTIPNRLVNITPRLLHYHCQLEIQKLFDFNTKIEPKKIVEILVVRLRKEKFGPHNVTLDELVLN